MYQKNHGVDLNGGHVVEGLDKLLLPRQELLFGSVQSQKSQQLLELHRKYKRRLMHPLQVNKQLRVMKELDFLVPERDFLTWVQFSGLESNPEVEKLMEDVKNISNVTQHVFRGKSVQDAKNPPRPLRKEDFLKKNLPKEVYKMVRQATRKDNDKEEGEQENEKLYRDTLGIEEEDTTTLEDQEEKIIEAEDEETLMKQLSEIQHNKRNLKQLNNNVYFRYTKRKLLLLRSLGSLPSKEEIVKTFFQKVENNFHERDMELREKLKQELSNDARLILTHKKNLYEFHQKLHSRGNITIEDMIKRCSSVNNFGDQEKERVTGPTVASENFDTARGVKTSQRKVEYSSSSPGKPHLETKQPYPSTLQHLDEIPSSGTVDSENVEKESKPSIVNIKSSRKLIRDQKGTTSLGTFDSVNLKSQAMISTRCQTRQDMSFEERRKKMQSDPKVFERLTGENSGRKTGSQTQRSPDPRPKVKTLSFTKTNGFNSQAEQTAKTPLRCVSKGKIIEMANRTPEKSTAVRYIMRRGPQTSRLDTEPENTSSYRDDRPPSKEMDIRRMRETERCIERAWHREPAPRNTVGYRPEKKSIKGDTEAILSSYGYRDYSLLEARRSMSAQKIRSRSNPKGLREMMDKTENTLRSMILRKPVTFDLDERMEQSARLS